MFAVVKTGGKQYPIKNGSIIKVEKLEGEIGKIISLDEVLFTNSANDNVAIVKAEILEQKKGKKIVIFKKRRRKNYKRKNGHRQYCTILKIIDIQDN